MKNGSAEKMSLETPDKKDRGSSDKKETISEKTPSPTKKQKIDENQSQGMEIEPKLMPKFKQKPLSLSSSCTNSQAVEQKLKLGSNNGEFSFNGPNNKGDSSQ